MNNFKETEPTCCVGGVDVTEAVERHQNVEPLSRNFTKSEHYSSDKNDRKFDLDCQQFLNGLQLSPSAIDALQMQTIRQTENDLWRKERRFRLTSSNFGRVLHLGVSYPARRNLVEKVLSMNGGFSNDAMQYGKLNEQKAVDAYQNYSKQVVKKCGLFVHPQYGYLASSPDGLIGDDGILEVKCPSSASRRSYLQKCAGDWKYRLKNEHDYFYQIQGQLEVTGRKWCDFVVWTPQGIELIERIYRDKSVWNGMFLQLEKFYKLSLLPEIVDPRIRRGLPIREPDFVVEEKNAMEMRRKNHGKQPK